ncbi:MFS transporter [Actinomycetospora cinnamomea]|uniref:Nitrate/nitrite transporter NarK n=1 Tax=Actinomycetospora cinnamomea TaxID=663609 RepID=A0A2U1EUS3_9PSEU|nr:MFS transporter [Actinomycetospora cinnamomea]PVZ03675.1 nitrate/nitrite transporter NarK [Actinomycetospora cinnamomea]
MSTLGAAHPVVPPRRSGRALVVFGVAVLAYVAAVLGRSSLAATGVEAAERFTVSSGVLSLLAVVQLAVYAALQVPAGVLADRLGPRRLIAGGAVLVAVGQVVLALAAPFWLAVAGRMLVGAGDAVTFVSVLRLIPSWFPARRVPVLNQLAGILGQLGQVVSAVPLAALVVGAGWTPAYLAAGGTAVLVAVLVLAVVRDGPAGAAAVSAPAIAGGLGAALREPGVRLAFWCHLAAPFPGNVFGLLWGFPFLTGGEGLGAGAARSLLALYVVAGIAIGPLFGTLAGRWPARRVRLVVGSVLAQATTWLVVLAWPGPAPAALVVLLVVVLGGGGPASLVAFDIARAAVPPERLGRASGIVNVGGFVSTVAVVLLVGLALDLQDAGTPDTYDLTAFRLAMLVQVPVWLVALLGIARSARRVRPRGDGPWPPAGARGSPRGAAPRPTT